jgi:phytoene synthase
VTALSAPGAPAAEPARAVIRKHSKSFALASLLLGRELGDAASVLYAYCRRADDAVDLVEPERAPTQVEELERELNDVYSGRRLDNPVLREFQRLVFDKHIPRAYPQALLEGFRLDAAGTRYQTSHELYYYCWCVAGSVGAMMCHVLGVRRRRALVHGAHLGMAMQLTNICRDVAEDFERGRVYLPTELAPGLAPRGPGERLSRREAALCSGAVRQLLAEAELFYASGDAGLPFLAFRSRLAVATARHVYAAIGRKLLERGADVGGPRAYVSAPEKWWHVARAGLTCTAFAPLIPHFHAARLTEPLRYPDDVLRF